MDKKKLWVVCPCFFDVDSFCKTELEARRAVMEKFPDFSLHFVLIDDSAGADPKVADLKTRPDLSILHMPYNLGHQAAIVYALRTLGNEVAENDYLITMDADGEDRPEDTPALLNVLVKNEKNSLQIVLAWRTFRRETMVFKIGYFCFRNVFRLLTGKQIKNGNFAAFRGLFLKEIIFHPHFDQCYSSSFISLPLQIDFVALPRGVRFFGTTKMGYMNLITHGLKMLMPLTERIAIRGVVTSAFLAFLSLLCLLVLIRSSFVAAVFAFFALFSMTLIAGLFALLFATFSQSKATSLRRLREISLPNK